MKITEKKFGRIILLALVVIINVGLDQVTKFIARGTLMGQGRINVVGDVFILQYAENTGSFLGLGASWPEPLKFIILIILPIAFLIGLIVYCIKTPAFTGLQITAFACIAGGGVSNIFDRIAYGGKVVDFMNFGIGTLRTGILNVADLSVFVGAVIFVISLKGRKNQGVNIPEAADE